MSTKHLSRLLVAALAVALAGDALFVWTSGVTMPDLVAAHFSGGGMPDAYVPRTQYLGLMLPLVFGLPALLAVLALGLSRVGDEFINLPNKTYWLSPQRRPATLAYLQRHLLMVALGLAQFMTFVHWQVVQANRSRLVRFDSDSTLLALLVLAAALLVWLAVLVRHFARRR